MHNICRKQATGNRNDIYKQSWSYDTIFFVNKKYPVFLHKKVLIFMKRMVLYDLDKT